MNITKKYLLLVLLCLIIKPYECICAVKGEKDDFEETIAGYVLKFKDSSLNSNRNAITNTCKGVGGYTLGEVYNTNMSDDDIYENDKVKVDNYKSFMCFSNGCYVWLTPKSRKIYRISLLGPKGKAKNMGSLNLGPIMGGKDVVTEEFIAYNYDKNCREAIDEAAEFIEKHYSGYNKSTGFRQNDWLTTYEYTFGDIKLYIDDYKGIGYMQLYCESDKYWKIARDENMEILRRNNEIQRQKKENKFKNTDTSGLN